MENNEQTETKVTSVTNSQPQQVVKTVKSTTPPVIAQEPPQKVYNTKKAIFRTYQVIWYLVGFIEILLGFRIFLKMLGANAYSGFANLIYAVTDPIAKPFYGVFNVTVTNQAVFEWSTIIAGFVYALVAYGIIQLLQIIKPTDKEEVELNVDNTQ